MSLREHAERQSGVVTRRQALLAGLSSEMIKSRVEGLRWQRLHVGVYAVFSGPVPHSTRLWAAVLRAGDGAALSYQSAAELDGLADKPSSLIHVTIPANRRAVAVKGTVVHTRHDAERAKHPTRLPPRTRLEETVLDLADDCHDATDALGWITGALGRRLTTRDRLRDAMDQRSRLRWRRDISLALTPGLAGIHSALEYSYFRYVERPHGLPRASRQAKFHQSGSFGYRDVLYDEYAVVVELDGDVAHRGDKRWRDIRRDNAAATEGVITLRYGYRDVTGTPCLVAAQVAQVLRARGWKGTVKPCSANCEMGRLS
jgi:hypothetical protein